MIYEKIVYILYIGILVLVLCATEWSWSVCGSFSSDSQTLHGWCKIHIFPLEKKNNNNNNNNNNNIMKIIVQQKICI